MAPDNRINLLRQQGLTDHTTHQQTTQTSSSKFKNVSYCFNATESDVATYGLFSHQLFSQLHISEYLNFPLKSAEDSMLGMSVLYLEIVTLG